jgi:hypothetical protein
VAVDDHKKAVPIAFLICSQERADLLQKFLEAVTAKVCASLRFDAITLRPLIFRSCEHHLYAFVLQVRKVKPDWMPLAVIVDA